MIMTAGYDFVLAKVVGQLGADDPRIELVLSP
jgi:hypothetical protein